MIKVFFSYKIVIIPSYLQKFLKKWKNDNVTVEIRHILVAEWSKVVLCFARCRSCDEALDSCWLWKAWLFLSLPFWGFPTCLFSCLSCFRPSVLHRVSLFCRPRPPLFLQTHQNCSGAPWWEQTSSPPELCELTRHLTLLITKLWCFSLHPCPSR